MSRICPPCERPVRDGYLCHRCTATLAETIRSAPVWADQLVLVLARLTRYSDGGGARSAVRPLPYNPAATGPARTLDGALRRAAGACGAPPEVRVARLGVVAAWLCAHVDVLRRLPVAPELESAISKAVEGAVATSDRPPEHWYAGRCPDCGTDLYPLVTEPIVECDCGRSWQVEQRRAELLATARDQIAPGPSIARALTSLGQPVTAERLRKWRHSGVLEVRHMTRQPPTNWYRVGDVLDLVTTEAVRKSRRRS